MASHGKYIWTWTSLALAAVIITLNWPLLLGTAAPIWDADHAFSTWQMLLADHARNGQFLLWNPWSNGGSPDGFEPQIGAFSPFNVVVGFLTGGSYWGFIVYWLSLWCVAGLGMLALLRHLDSPPWIAFIISLGFALSGGFTGHAEHTPVIHAMAWLPWVVWRADLAINTKRFWHFVEAAALFGLSGLGGYPGLTIASGMFVALWITGRAIFTEAAGTRQAILGVLTIAILGATIMSPAYVGFLTEARGYTARSGALPKEIVLKENALHPGAVATLSSPYCPRLWMSNNAPNLRSPKLWSYTDVSSLSLYVGPLVLWWAFLSMSSSEERNWKMWLIALILLFLGLAMAKSLPLRGWFYDFFLPFRYFRHASMLRFYPIFCLCILASYGSKPMTRLLKRSGELKKIKLYTGLAALISVCSLEIVFSLAENQGPFPTLARVHCFGAWFGVLAVAFAPRRVKATLLMVALLGLALLDGTFNHMSSREFMYDRSSVVLEGWKLLEQEHTSKLTDIPMQREFRPKGPGHSNKNLPIKVPALSSYTAMRNPMFEGLVAHPRAASLAMTQDRFWFSSNPLRMEPTREGLDALLERLDRGDDPPLLIHPRSQMLSPQNHRDPNPTTDLRNQILLQTAAVKAELKNLRYEPNLLEFEVDCPESGYLLVTDRWAPGWECRVNDHEVEVEGGWFVFRSIPVERGRNRVSFRYHPAGFPALILVSWLILGGVGIGTLKPIDALKPKSRP